MTEMKKNQKHAEWIERRKMQRKKNSTTFDQKSNEKCREKEQKVVKKSMQLKFQHTQKKKKKRSKRTLTIKRANAKERKKRRRLTQRQNKQECSY